MFHSSHYPMAPAGERIARGWRTVQLGLFLLAQKAALATWNAVLFLIFGLLLAVSRLFATVLIFIGIPLALTTAVALLTVAVSLSVLLVGAVLTFLGSV